VLPSEIPEKRKSESKVIVTRTVVPEMGKTEVIKRIST
jgi:hypothetical protein